MWEIQLSQKELHALMVQTKCGVVWSCRPLSVLSLHLSQAEDGNGALQGDECGCGA